MPEILPPLESLLDATEANDAQLWLTLGEIGFSPVRVDRTGPKKRYTGAVLFRENQPVYRAIILLGAEPGISIRRICEVCHVTDDTVKAVLAREPVAVAAQKKHLLTEGRLTQRATLERLNELAPTMTAKDAAVTFGIVTDKVELLSGGVTARVEVTDGAAVLKRFLDLHERIAKTVRGEVIEAEEIGSAGENAGTKAIEPGEPGPTAPDPITSDNEYHIKSESVDSEGHTDHPINARVIINTEGDGPTVPAPDAPAVPEDRGAGIDASREAPERHRYIQPKIL